MKNTFKTLGVMVAALFLLSITSAFAADDFGIDVRPSPSGFVHASLTTNTGAILVPAISLTNIPANAAYILKVPVNGFGVGLRMGGSNTTTAVTNLATNIVFTLEGVIFPTGSRSGGTQVVDNAVITISTPLVNTTACSGYDYLTNFTPYLTTSTALQRCDGFRLRSIVNTNTESVWITNLFQIRD